VGIDMPFTLLSNYGLEDGFNTEVIIIGEFEGIEAEPRLRLGRDAPCEIIELWVGFGGIMKFTLVD
jgi:hypothetical protein